MIACMMFRFKVKGSYGGPELARPRVGGCSGCGASRHRSQRLLPVAQVARLQASPVLRPLRGAVVGSGCLLFQAQKVSIHCIPPSPEFLPGILPPYRGGGDFRAWESPKRGKTGNFGVSSKPYPPLVTPHHTTRNQPGNSISGAFCFAVWCHCQALGKAG